MFDLSGMTALEDLELNSTQISDAGLAHLKGLTALKNINFGSTKITDATARNG